MITTKGSKAYHDSVYALPDTDTSEIALLLPSIYVPSSYDFNNGLKPEIMTFNDFEKIKKRFKIWDFLSYENSKKISAKWRKDIFLIFPDSINKTVTLNRVFLTPYD